MLQTLTINAVDSEEYPAVEEIDHRCVSMISRLFHAPRDNENNEAVGTSTIGSSEAIILAVLAAKKRWKNKRKAEGKSVRHTCAYCLVTHAELTCSRCSDSADGEPQHRHERRRSGVLGEGRPRTSRLPLPTGRGCVSPPIDPLGRTVLSPVHRGRGKVLAR